MSGTNIPPGFGALNRALADLNQPSVSDQLYAERERMRTAGAVARMSGTSPPPRPEGIEALALEIAAIGVQLPHVIEDPDAVAIEMRMWGERVRVRDEDGTERDAILFAAPPVDGIVRIE